jgi:hypothetical protein
MSPSDLGASQRPAREELPCRLPHDGETLYSLQESSQYSGCNRVIFSRKRANGPRDSSRILGFGFCLITTR